MLTTYSLIVSVRAALADLQRLCRILTMIQMIRTTSLNLKLSPARLLHNPPWTLVFPS